MANREEITPPKLSQEIVLFHILPKLPVKSLLRSKCVCKQWRTFLATPLFAKIHLRHVTALDRYRHEKVIFFPDKPRNFQTIDCEDGSLAKPRCLPFAGYALMVASNSVNGLVCVGIGTTTTEFSDIILWNPLTGEYKTISRPIDTKCYTMLVMAFELYYNSLDDDYKILRVTIDGDVYVYSLKSDLWRRLNPPTLREDIPYAGAGDHSLLDGKLHFMVPGSMIMRLELQTEKLTKIAVPPACEHGQFKLMVVRGCIELTTFKDVSPGTWIIEMWRMNGDGNWTKMVNISYSHDPNRILLPLYLLRNGNLIMHTEKGDCSWICKVDREKNTEDVFCSDPDMVLLSRIYVETFVSPKQYA